MNAIHMGLGSLCLPLLFVACFTSKAIFWVGFISSQLWPLSRIPGPRWAAYTRLWLVRTLTSGRSVEKFIELNQKYGPLVRIGPNQLLVSDPDVTRRILAAGSRYIRAPSFDALRVVPDTANVVSERDPKKHDQLRHILSAGLAGRDVTNMESIIDEHVSSWVWRLDPIAWPEKSKVVNLGKSIQYLSMDIISHLCLGEGFGCVDDNKDQYEFLGAVQTGIVASLYVSMLRELHVFISKLTKIPLIRRYLIPSTSDRSGIGKVMGVVHKAIDQRFPPNSVPNTDILGSFLKKGLSRSQADTELLVTLVAGSDTTSTAVQSTLLAIISNPRVYGKLQLEIDLATSHDEISTPIQDVEARQLPYLQACILEGLRKHPPVGQLRERVVPPEGDVIHGYRIPGGTFIGFNTWGTQLSKIYGDDPEIFRPERWLIEDEERLHAMYRTHELIFGYGSSKCLGTRIANLELNKIFFELLRYFDIATVNPARPWRSTCYGSFFQEDFNVCITRRERWMATPAFVTKTGVPR